jgi:predicted nucleic acid-binding protein
LSAYVDSSFLVSLYTMDANSPPASRVMRHVSLPVFLAPLGELELTNALQLRIFRKELDSAQVKEALSWFRRDLAAGIFALKPISARAYERAKQIARKRTPQLGTRTFDVLHVASALLLQADAFYTFDTRQAKLARAEGLNTPSLP